MDLESKNISTDYYSLKLSNNYNNQSSTENKNKNDENSSKKRTSVPGIEVSAVNDSWNWAID